MKEKRNLSGVYFRVFLNNTWEIRCFEDLPEEEQIVILRNFSPEQVRLLCLALANTLNDLGDELDILKT